MYGLIKLVYDNAKQNAFENLYEDSDVKTQFLLRSALSQALQDYPNIIPSHGNDWILCTLTLYKQNEEETIRVFQSIMKCLYTFSYGMLTEDIKWQEMNYVADTCMVGISFFKEYMETQHKRKAAPSVDYYSKMGSLAYHRLGYDNIGDHFEGWTNFINKEFHTLDIK